MVDDTALREPAEILVPISLGELLDKITILQIKVEKLSGVGRQNVIRELTALKSVLADAPIEVDVGLKQQLLAINQELWAIEDAIRLKEAGRDFGPEFIKLARAVYQKNDLRAAIKKKINVLCRSLYVEEKCYPVLADS